MTVLAVVFPPVCLACGTVEGNHSQPLCLCSACRNRLTPVKVLPCALCGKALKSNRLPAVFRCRSCWSAKSPIKQQFALWAYQPPLDSVIRALKFNKMEFLGEQLAEALHHNYADELSEINVVVPIPLHWCRRLKRGYNQAESIAMPISSRLGAPLIRALRRRRSTRPQAQLNREARLENLTSAFAPIPSKIRHLADRHVLLVDDVTTTGATLRAATASLGLCNVKSVTVMTVGSTPDGPRLKNPQVLTTVGDTGFIRF